MDVGNFIKSTAKSALDRIIGKVVDNVANGVARSGRSAASSTAQSLVNAGASYQSMSSFAASKTDSVISKGDPRFAAKSGKDVAKTASVDITRVRQQGTESTSMYIDKINPQTAIEAKRREKAVEILVATP